MKRDAESKKLTLLIIKLHKVPCMMEKLCDFGLVKKPEDFFHICNKAKEQKDQLGDMAYEMMEYGKFILYAKTALDILDDDMRHPVTDVLIWGDDVKLTEKLADSIMKYLITLQLLIDEDPQKNLLL